MTTLCPFCGAFSAASALEEVDHMNAAHADVVRARLREAGEWVAPDEFFPARSEDPEVRAGGPELGSGGTDLPTERES